MDRLRAVLAATDFSEFAQAAATRAALMAAENKAELRLLHVVEGDAVTILMKGLNRPDIRAAIAGQAEMQLATLANKLLHAHLVVVRRELRIGKPLQELNAAASDSDIVVMGARGTSSIRAFTLGSTADRLVRSLAKPVLVVRTKPKTVYRRVLALIDFSMASRTALDAAFRVAPAASFHLLHAVDVPYEGKLRYAGVPEEDISACRAQEAARAMQQFEALLSALEKRKHIRTSVEYRDLRQILGSLDSIRPDLIAVGKHPDSSIWSFVLGSTTRTVLAQAPCDVLVGP